MAMMACNVAITEHEAAAHQVCEADCCRCCYALERYTALVAKMGVPSGCNKGKGHMSSPLSICNNSKLNVVGFADDLQANDSGKKDDDNDEEDNNEDKDEDKDEGGGEGSSGAIDMS